MSVVLLVANQGCTKTLQSSKYYEESAKYIGKNMKIKQTWRSPEKFSMFWGTF